MLVLVADGPAIPVWLLNEPDCDKVFRGHGGWCAVKSQARENPLVEALS